MRAFRICKIFGVDIEIHWTWLGIFVIVIWSMKDNLARLVPGQPQYLYWLAGGIATLLLFLSVLAHELAHSIVAKKFKVPIKRITLFIFGGAAQMEENIKTAKDEFLIAIAGPASSFSIAGLFWLATVAGHNVFSRLFMTSFFSLAVINVWLAGVNLLPCFPLDGGRVLRSAWWWITKDVVKATKAIFIIGIGAGFLLPVGFFFLGGWFSAVWIGMIYLLFLLPPGYYEYKRVLLENAKK